MLELCDTDQRVMPPTELYNEGWMLRLTLDWFASHPDVDHLLAVPSDAVWYSEALLASRFLPRERGDQLAESYTHADGAIGHFGIGGSGAGDLVLLAGARHFVVTEAKLQSKLSSGTKNASGYDQAARNVACMAHILSVKGPRPEKMDRLGFAVLAPASQISLGVFEKELTKESLRAKVEARVATYRDSARDAWFTDWFLPTLDQVQVVAVSWEEIADVIGEVAPDGSDAFRVFYQRCLAYNGLGGSGTPA